MGPSRIYLHDISVDVEESETTSVASDKHSSWNDRATKTKLLSHVLTAARG